MLQMELSLFNFATTSHPHAVRVGLHARVHTDTARHCVSRLVLETLLSRVCGAEVGKRVCIMDDLSPMFQLH